jgi:gliding motility-associated-like protein
LLTVTNAGILSYKLKSNIASGQATITVTIRDNGGTTNGGVDKSQQSFTLTINPVPVITITSDKGSTVSKGDVVHLTATGGVTYNWDNAAGIVSGRQTAVLEIRPQANTTYPVTVTSAAGCSSTASINIAIIEDFKVDATNIVTPNGDGKNDRWVIHNIDSYPNNEVKIFDRAGRLMYQRRNYNNEWDGTLNGRPLAEGTYYYMLTISGGKTAKGAITIIRDRY